MKSQTIRLTGKRQVDYATKLINECLDEDELWCVDIKKYKEAKTLQQLRALFGTWYDYISETLGESKDWLHQVHKSHHYKADEIHVKNGKAEFVEQIKKAPYGGWLCSIYYENPQNKVQQMWAELRDYLINDYKNNPNYGTHCELVEHEMKISLSWSTIDQMREYMNRIEHYYITAGYPLPILEKYKRWYL